MTFTEFWYIINNVCGRTGVIIMEKTKNKSNVFNLIICGIAFAVMIVYLLFVDKIDHVIGALKSINPLFIVLCTLFMGGYWLCESGSVYVILKQLHPKIRFGQCWTNTIIGQYFNCITPFASGGQPMQAYYYIQGGVPLGAGLTALLSRFIVYQFALTVYSVFTLIFGINQFGEELSQKGLLPFVFIGFVINNAVIVFLLGIAFRKNGTLKVANALITLLAKMRIIKKPLSKRMYITREANKFFTNFKFIKKNVWVIAKSCFFTFAQLILYFSITYLLCVGFDKDPGSFLKVVSYQAYVNMITSFIPLPGAIGGAELGFSGFFNGIFGDYTNVAMMLWRILTFYLPILVGIAHILTMRGKGYKEPSNMEAMENLYNMEKSITEDEDND